MYDSLSQSAKAADIKVIANERYARSDSSVTAQVLRALAARPDAIMLGGTGTPGALPVIALSERGYKGPLYGNHGLISADFLRLAGKAANGIICPTGPVTAAEQLPAGNPIQKVALDFRTAFEKANGEAPTDSFSSYAFDGWLVAQMRKDPCGRSEVSMQYHKHPGLRLRCALCFDLEVATAPQCQALSLACDNNRVRSLSTRLGFLRICVNKSTRWCRWPDARTLDITR